MDPIFKIEGKIENAMASSNVKCKVEVKEFANKLVSTSVMKDVFRVNCTMELYSEKSKILKKIIILKIFHTNFLQNSLSGLFCV